MVQARENLRLPLEPRHPIGILGEFIGQYLQRHLASELFILGAPHLAHPADAKGINHAVVGKGHSRFDAHSDSPLCTPEAVKPVRFIRVWNRGSFSSPGM